jgi:hypothetical protein
MHLRWIMLAAAISGCGGGGGGPLTIEDYGAALVTAQCQVDVRCGAAKSQSACEHDLTPMDTVSIAAAITAGKVTFDPDAAQMCVDATAQLPCDGNAMTNRTPVAGCADAIVGLANPGDPCQIDAECTQGECQTPSCGSACCTGMCLAVTTGLAIGTPCQQDTECVGGAFCQIDGSGNQACAALLVAGASCFAGDQCDYGLQCLGGDGRFNPPGMCGAGPHAGDPCNDGACADVGVACNATSTCVQVGLAGDACDGETACSPLLICTGGSCQEYPKVGEPCTVGCASGAFCMIASGLSVGTCVARQDNGATCATNAQCTSRYCDLPEGSDAGTCADEPACE